MIRIDPYKTVDFSIITDFVEAIQEHERNQVPELKSGSSIGKAYAESLIEKVNQHNGVILIASSQQQAIGFICGYVDEDDDMLIFRIFLWLRSGDAKVLLLIY